MAVRFLNGEVSELCLGKPELTWIPATATISDALTALKTSGDTHVSVWFCGGGDSADYGCCACVGKFCMTDVILFLCKEENLADPFKAFEAPVSDILPKGFPIVRHLEPNSSLLDAIHYILEGTQNLVIPIQNNHHRKKKFLNRKTCPRHVSHEYCWLTQEEVIRFLLNSIASFSPIPTLTIESLDLIDREISTVHYNQPASSLLAHLHRALAQQTSIAIVDEGHRLIGEISPSNLTCCDETVAAAIRTLSAVDLMTYIGGPPEDLVQLARARIEERGLGRMVEMMDEILLHSWISSSSSSSSSCSSEDEESLLAGRNIPIGRSRYYYRSEAIVCGRRSSLVAVMIQALAHRVGCVWVVEEDQTVVGMVTFRGILRVLCGRGKSKSEMDG